MTNYILRRNNWGKPSCDNINKEYPEIVVINKDKEDMPKDAKWIVRWATTSTLPAQDTAPKIINTAKAIHKVFDKGYFRVELANRGLAPRTFLNMGDWKYGGEKVLPVIVRPTKHSASKDLYFCTTQDEIQHAVSEISDKGECFYISEFIEKEHEYRVFIANGRALAVMEKHPENKNAVSWGIDETWEYIPWANWPLEMVNTACKSFLYSGLNIGAVDMMTKGLQSYCLEINSGPLLSKYYGAQMAKGIRWIIENDNRNNLPINAVITSHKDLIHPALV